MKQTLNESKDLEILIIIDVEKQNKKVYQRHNKCYMQKSNSVRWKLIQYSEVYITVLEFYHMD